MGATAITAVAGVRLLASPLPGRLPELAPVIMGVSFMPAVVLFGVWRYGRRRHPVVYEPALWSIVFPMGMYGTATDLFGRAAGLPWLPSLAWVAIWVAYVAWAIVFIGMLHHLLARRARPKAG